MAKYLVEATSMSDEPSDQPNRIVQMCDRIVPVVADALQKMVIDQRPLGMQIGAVMEAVEDMCAGLSRAERAKWLSSEKKKLAVMIMQCHVGRLGEILGRKAIDLMDELERDGPAWCDYLIGAARGKLKVQLGRKRGRGSRFC